MTALTAASLADGELATREERLVQRLERASAPKGISFSEKWLFAIGGASVLVGFVLVIAGWAGAAHTVLVEGQIPYLISGGLLGLGFIILGGFLYFGRWLVVLTRLGTERAASDGRELEQIRLGIQELNRNLSGAPGPSAVMAARHGPDVVRVNLPAEASEAPWFVTANGSTAHRPDCRVVSGRTDLTRVDYESGLSPCGICRPAGLAHSRH